ncbi:hypothetical protein SEA_KRADAL_273 [Streptomyces phage Kradal]|nr:hypothetical protein SEA_KRADAL_273 [Streptomyces phage Kradal]QPL14581.1 hypothetical protein SEA_EHYELIMAYOE_276 [Streptomyces phage EhyElimayoE]
MLHGSRKRSLHVPSAAGRRDRAGRYGRESHLMDHFIGAIAHLFSIFIVRRQS